MPCKYSSSEPWVERLGLDVGPLPLAGLIDCDSVCGRTREVWHAASSPHARYLLACAALAAMMAAPLVTWGLMRPSDASPEAAYRIRSTPPVASSTGIADHRHVARFRPRSGVQRAAGTVPVLGRNGLACRRAGVLGASGGRLGGCRAHAVDAGPARAAGMAGDSEETWSTDWSLSSRAVAGLRAGAGADGGRLAASGGVGSSRGARRSACRAFGSAAAA